MSLELCCAGGDECKSFSESCSADLCYRCSVGSTVCIKVLTLWLSNGGLKTVPRQPSVLFPLDIAAVHCCRNNHVIHQILQRQF